MSFRSTMDRRGGWTLGRAIRTGFVLLLSVAAGLSGASLTAGSPAIFPAAPHPGSVGASEVAVPLWHPNLPSHARPLSTVVNPYLSYSSEPAPMGISDFGVTAAGTGYSYSTPVWVGTANISKMWANDGSNTTGHTYVSFQLNVVVKFTHGPSTYAYWIQDVADVDTLRAGIDFLNNIWNLSSGTGAMDSTAVSGNGSVNYCPASSCGRNLYWYADGPGCTAYPGNCKSLRYPAVVALRVTTGTFNGLVHVSFQYNDGSGWVTYDNATFPFSRGYVDLGFTVDGTQYVPLGVFYDAEFDFTGPGGGVATTNTNSNLTLGLQYWNGHNLQSPLNTYNFGGNTGESISNVVSSALFGSLNGSAGGRISNGGGSLGMLYSRSDVAVLNVSTPTVDRGTVFVGAAPHPFVGKDADLTLGPGTYDVSLWNGSVFVANATVHLSRGGYTFLVLSPRPPPAPNPVTLEETGLPAGTSWSVAVNGVPSQGPSMAFSYNLTNGTYQYSIGPVPGFSTPTYSGTIAVSGAPVTLIVPWSRFVYSVTFSETGLQGGTLWSVALGGQTQAGTGTSLTFSEPNGTFPFTVSSLRSVSPSPASGSVSITGQADQEFVSFSLTPAYLVGRVSPATAVLSVGGTTEATSASGLFNVSLVPGTYDVSVQLSGYHSWSRSVTVTAGNATTEDVTLVSLGGGSSSNGTSPGSFNLPGGVGTLIVLVVAAAVALGVVAAALRARHR